MWICHHSFKQWCNYTVCLLTMAICIHHLYGFVYITLTCYEMYFHHNIAAAHVGLKLGLFFVFLLTFTYTIHSWLILLFPASFSIISLFCPPVLPFTSILIASHGSSHCLSFYSVRPSTTLFFPPQLPCIGKIRSSLALPALSRFILRG